MKISNVIRLGLFLIAITMTACSSSGGGGAPALPQKDSISEADDRLSKAEQALVDSAQVEQDAVKAETPQE